MSFKTPVLLLTWRRPDTTRRILKAIRSVAPEHIYIASDGPRLERQSETEKVDETREILKAEIDWQAEVYYRFSDVNQGCGPGVVNSINWFFSQVNEGIILEDDCLPHRDFFFFCEELLERYRSDSRIWSIGGSNLQDGHRRGDASYYFSRYFEVWGWATWRDRWQHYDFTLSDWGTLRNTDFLENIHSNPIERDFWACTWEDIYQHKRTDVWDYQWVLTCMRNQGLSIIPNLNLISNIGFGEGAVHTTSGTPIALAEEQHLFPLTHPKAIVPHCQADRYYAQREFLAHNKRHQLSFHNIKTRLQSIMRQFPH